MQRIQHRIYEPSGEAEPSSPNAMLVLPNQASTTLRGYHGALAQEVADTTGNRVLAYERLFSGEGQRFSPAARRLISRYFEYTIRHTSEQLAGVVEQEMPDRLYVAGHSAASFDAIGLAESGEMRFGAMVLTDPPGMRQCQFGAEITDYAMYQWRVERNKPAGEPYENRAPEVEPGKFGRLARMVGELIVYGGYGGTPQSLHRLERVIMANPNTGVGVVFPEHTFTVQPEEQIVIKHALERLRLGQGAPVIVERGKGDYHSSFDNYAYYASLVDRMIERVDPTLSGS